MTLEELRVALAECRDVDAGEAGELLNAEDAQARALARTALLRTEIRRALVAAVELAAEQKYSDQNTLATIEKLASLSDVDEPFLETGKQLGLQAAAAGQLDRAMQLFQSVLNRAVAAGQRRDMRSRECMRFLYDREMGAAVDALGASLPKPPFRRPETPPYRLGVLCSALQDEDGPSIVTLKRIELFAEYGFEIDVVSTELASSTGSSMLAALLAKGFAFTVIPGGTYRQRIAWLTQHFTERPADAIMYEASGADYLAQLAAAVRMAPVQFWDHKGFEPQAGTYDVVAQALSPEQVAFSRWPEAAKFYGTPIAIADEIDAAEPFSRRELGLPDDAIVIGTFGRMEKCITDEYMHSLVAILSSDPRTWLLLAGPDTFDRMNAMLEQFSRAGVGARVKYLGRRQKDAPRLVKSIDLYCDTHPWNGGQSLLDAMQAGAPIVAMRKPVNAALDPHAVGPSAVADVMLDGVVEMAPAGDGAAYIRIARALVADPERRRRDGTAVRQRAVERCSIRVATFKIADDIKASIERS